MSDIERYLSELRSHLADLDPGRAEEIVAEARSHLDARMAQLRSEGLGEDEAAATAVRGFGEPGPVAKRLRRANAGYQHVGPFRLLIAVQLGLAGSSLSTHLLARELTLPFDLAGLAARSALWVQVLVFGLIAGPAALLGGLAAGRSWWWLPAAPVAIMGFMWSVLGSARGEITREAVLVAGGIAATAAVWAFGGARIRLRSPAGIGVTALALAVLLLLDHFDYASNPLGGLSVLVLLHLWWQWRSANARRATLEASHV